MFALQILRLNMITNSDIFIQKFHEFILYSSDA